jgi:hypothetical protein
LEAVVVNSQIEVPIPSILINKAWFTLSRIEATSITIVHYCTREQAMLKLTIALLTKKKYSRDWRWNHSQTIIKRKINLWICLNSIRIWNLFNFIWEDKQTCLILVSLNSWSNHLQDSLCHLKCYLHHMCSKPI